MECATNKLRWWYWAEKEKREEVSNSHEDVVRLFMLLFVPQVLELISHNNLDTVTYNRDRKLINSFRIPFQIIYLWKEEFIGTFTLSTYMLSYQLVWNYEISLSRMKYVKNESTKATLFWTHSGMLWVSPSMYKHQQYEKSFTIISFLSYHTPHILNNSVVVVTRNFSFYIEFRETKKVYFRT